MAHVSSQPSLSSLRSPTPPESDTEVFGVMYQKYHVPPQDNLEMSVKSGLRNEAERMALDQVGDKLVYGNSGGIMLLQDMQEMKDDLAILKSKEQSREAKDGERARDIVVLQKDVVALRKEVRLLAQNSEGYLSIRRRFLDVFKRDIRNMQELRGSKSIRGGNVVAHHGDAVGDAFLFHHDKRTDRSLYRDLYGLDPSQVLEKFDSTDDDGGLFLVLNAHATMLALGQPIPDDLKAAFRDFLIQVEDNWEALPIKDHSTPLGAAYWAFWNCHGQ